MISYDFLYQGLGHSPMSQYGFDTIMNTSVLVILLAVSLTGNSLLIIVSATSPVHSAFNFHVMSMAVFGLFECTFTMSLATGELNID